MDKFNIERQTDFYAAAVTSVIFHFILLLKRKVIISLATCNISELGVYIAKILYC